jgi:hypothetical protein
VKVILGRLLSGFMIGSDHLGAYATGLDSLSGNEQSIWGHYNDMATTVDSLREREWSELADTILVFVG